MSLPINPPFAPMEAETALEIPNGSEWQYEPKWDGFRCLAFRDGSDIQLQSKSGQPLARYFPEVVEAVDRLKARKMVVDGEIIIPAGSSISFDDLLQRIHPAESRIRKLSAEHPAMMVIFDLLVDERGRPLVDKTLAERRARLEQFAAEYFTNGTIQLSPATPDLAEARRWFEQMRGGLDGIIAKRRDLPYESGGRGAMEKIKNLRTADCVIGGFRYASSGGVVGSLLLGLYDRDGLLHHVGFTSSIHAKDRAEVTRKLQEAEGGAGFTGRAPGGPSRWSTERSAAWNPVEPRYVVEVRYDHFTGGRFRHGTKLLRWRPDKAPEQCRMSQVERDSASPLGLLKAS